MRTAEADMVEGAAAVTVVEAGAAARTFMAADIPAAAVIMPAEVANIPAVIIRAGPRDRILAAAARITAGRHSTAPGQPVRLALSRAHRATPTSTRCPA